MRASGPDAPERAELEGFIRERFARQHGAAVRSFLPTLIGLWDPEEAVAGAAGYRPAVAGPLYLEQYFAESVQARIAGRTGGAPVRRSSVAEIGNFAARNCGTARHLIEVLAGWLREHQHDWAVFTATSQVRGIMAHLGVELIELGTADPACVQSAADDWGRYYATDPRVVVGHVPSWGRAWSPFGNA